MTDVYKVKAGFPTSCSLVPDDKGVGVLQNKLSGSKHPGFYSEVGGARASQQS